MATETKSDVPELFHDASYEKVLESPSKGIAKGNQIKFGYRDF